MPSISVPAAVVAGGSLIGGVAKGIMGSNAAKAASDKEVQAAHYAELLRESGYNTLRSDLAPYVSAGESAIPALLGYTPQAQQMLLDQYGATRAMQPGAMTEEELVKTPGYQFALSQGLKAVQNSAAARGLGVSGTALKGAAKFTTGLADETYQNQFKIKQTQFEDANKLLSGLGDITKQGYEQYLSTAGLGAKALGTQAEVGERYLSGAAGDITGQGNAAAAGITKSNQQLGGIFDTLSNLPATYFGADKFFSGGGGSAPSNYTPATFDNPTGYTTGGFYDPSNSRY